MPYSKDTAPTVNGFTAGTSWKNTTVFIGRSWFGDNFIPGRVDVTAGNEGVYVADFQENRLSEDTEYLVVPSGCSCSWMAPEVAITQVGVVQMPDENNQFYIGRVDIGEGQIAISKVSPSEYSQIWATSGEELSNIATEILVCESTASPFVRPTINSPSKACAGWMKHKNDDTTTINGFSIGTSWKNNTAWVGRGHFSGQFQPGRIQIEASTGAYLVSDSDGEVFRTTFTEYLALSVGCSCSFVPVESVALSSSSLIHCVDFNNHWLIGRFDLGNGQVSIAKVMQSNDQIYIDLNGMSTLGGATEVLVCETS
jgi:hypothetical protein